jgi:hypothetical protein
MEEELSPADRARVASLPLEVEPDPALRERLVGHLTRAALLSRPRIPSALALVAALAVGFVAGLLLPRLYDAAPQGREFLLLVRDSPSMSVADEPRRVQEYGQWAHGLGARLVNGEKLSDTVSSVGPPGTLSTVGGFFRIRARDRAEAEAIARTCPHVRYGGSIEVREIERAPRSSAAGV